MAESELLQPGSADDVARAPLVRLAYRLLGSVEEAEDVVQDAHVKLLAAEQRPDNAQAWLFRIVTNLSLDRLRHLKVQRRAYFGPWLPEPILTPAPEGESVTELAENLSIALLLVLERLSPAERVAFVLREACDLSFAEMADVLNLEEAACRQRHHRARRKLGGITQAPAPAAAQRRALEQLMDAVSDGDAPRLAALLTDDAVLLTDGGGRVNAAIRPVTDPQRIARVLVHLGSREPAGTFRSHFQPVNGGVGVLLTRTGPAGALERYASVQLNLTAEGKVSAIYIVRNPEKLARL